MENITLNIHQDEAYNFFQNYDKLSRTQKKIWDLARWWVKRFPNAHPNQSTIAAKSGCRREHVNRTFALFKQWGWLGLGWRGRRLSKTLLIPKHLLLMDVVNREYFARLEITSKRTHSYSRYKKSTSGKAGSLDIPIYLQKTKLSFESKLKLSMVPENIYQKALESAKYHHSKGRKIANTERYVVGTAIRIAENRGIRLDWVKYYNTRKVA